MDDRTLSLFIDVCNEQSISKAAARNFISRQSLTKAMDKLEREIGVTLLVRTHVGISPTKEGKCLLGEARKRVRSWNNTLERIRTLNTDRKVLRFGCQMAMLNDQFVHSMLIENGTNLGTDFVFIDAAKDRCWNLLRRGRLDIAYTLDPVEDNIIVSSDIDWPFQSIYMLMNKNHELATVQALEASMLKLQRVTVLNDPSHTQTRLMGYLHRANAEVIFAPSIHSFIKKMLLGNESMFVAPGSAIVQFASPEIVAKPLTDMPPVIWQRLLHALDADGEVLQACDLIEKVLQKQLAGTSYTIEENGTVRFSEPYWQSFMQ